MKLSALRSLIREEAQKAIAERRLVRTEVRKAIKESLPKLGSGQRFKNLRNKFAKQEAAKPVTNEIADTDWFATKDDKKGTLARNQQDAKKKNESKAPVKEAKKSVKETRKPTVAEHVDRIVREEVRKALTEEPIRDPDALAASIGREKLGKAKFQDLAAKGRKKS